MFGGDPLSESDQRVPDTFAHIGQVHGVDSVLHPARAAQMLPFDARGGFTFLLLPGLIQRPDHQLPSPTSGFAGRFFQPGHREPSDLGHRFGLIPARPVQQPLRPIRCPVPDMLGNGPAVPLGQLTRHRPHIFTGLHERLDPPETRAQPFGQLTQFPPGQPSTWQPQPPAILSSSQTHDQQAAAPRLTGPCHTFPQVTTPMATAVPRYGRGRWHVSGHDTLDNTACVGTMAQTQMSRETRA